MLETVKVALGCFGRCLCLLEFPLGLRPVPLGLLFLCLGGRHCLLRCSELGAGGTVIRLLRFRRNSFGSNRLPGCRSRMGEQSAESAWFELTHEPPFEQFPCRILVDGSGQQCLANGIAAKSNQLVKGFSFTLDRHCNVSFPGELSVAQGRRDAEECLDLPAVFPNKPVDRGSRRGRLAKGLDLRSALTVIRLPKLPRRLVARPRELPKWQAIEPVDDLVGSQAPNIAEVTPPGTPLVRKRASFATPDANQPNQPGHSYPNANSHPQPTPNLLVKRIPITSREHPKLQPRHGPHDSPLLPWRQGRDALGFRFAIG